MSTKLIVPLVALVLLGSAEIRPAHAESGAEMIRALDRTRLLSDFVYGAHWDGYGHQHEMQRALRSFMRTWYQYIGHVCNSNLYHDVIKHLRNTRMIQAFELGAHWDGYGHQHRMQEAIRSFMATWSGLVPEMRAYGLSVSDPMARRPHKKIPAKKEPLDPGGGHDR